MSRIVVKVGGAVAAESAAAVLELAREYEVCVVHAVHERYSALIRTYSYERSLVR